MDKASRQIKNFWGNGLSPIPSEILVSLNLSLETKNFLRSIGLPVKPGGINNIVKTWLLVDFYNISDTLDSFTYRGEKYFAIASDIDKLGIVAAIKESTDEIFSIAITSLPVVPYTFVNSNIKLFLYCLQIYLVDYIENFDNLDNAQGLKVLRRVSRKFEKADPKSMAYEENFWPHILEFQELEFTDLLADD